MKPDKPSSRERIEHIINAINLIHGFIENHSLDSFSQDYRTYSACLYQFTIIGEAIVNIDQEILDKYDYPWYKVKSFRNFILHDYHAVDTRVVWDTSRLILPNLKGMMESILANEF